MSNTELMLLEADLLLHQNRLHYLTEEEWKLVEQQFFERWNFPHTLGALYVQHVAIRCPPSAGSLYFNYKGIHSIVLMALSDADYTYLYVDLGANKSSSDGGAFADIELKEAFEAGDIGVPDPEPLPGGTRPVPYFIVGENAFSLFPLQEGLERKQF